MNNDKVTIPFVEFHQVGAYDFTARLEPSPVQTVFNFVASANILGFHSASVHMTRYGQDIPASKKLLYEFDPIDREEGPRIVRRFSVHSVNGYRYDLLWCIENALIEIAAWLTYPESLRRTSYFGNEFYHLLLWAQIAMALDKVDLFQPLYDQIINDPKHPENTEESDVLALLVWLMGDDR